MTRSVRRKSNEFRKGYTSSEIRSNSIRNSINRDGSKVEKRTSVSSYDISRNDRSGGKKDQASLSVIIHHKNSRGVTIDVEDLTAGSDMESPRSLKRQCNGRKGNFVQKTVTSEVLGPSIGDVLVDTMEYAGALINFVAKGPQEKEGGNDPPIESRGKLSPGNVTMQQMRLILSPRNDEVILNALNACHCCCRRRDRTGDKEAEGENGKESRKRKESTEEMRERKMGRCEEVEEEEEDEEEDEEEEEEEEDEDEQKERETWEAEENLRNGRNYHEEEGGIMEGKEREEMEEARWEEEEEEQERRKGKEKESRKRTEDEEESNGDSSSSGIWEEERTRTDEREEEREEEELKAEEKERERQRKELEEERRRRTEKEKQDQERRKLEEGERRRWEEEERRQEGKIREGEPNGDGRRREEERTGTDEEEREREEGELDEEEERHKREEEERERRILELEERIERMEEENQERRRSEEEERRRFEEERRRFEEEREKRMWEEIEEISRKRKEEERKERMEKEMQEEERRKLEEDERRKRAEEMENRMWNEIQEIKRKKREEEENKKKMVESRRVMSFKGTQTVEENGKGKPVTQMKMEVRDECEGDYAVQIGDVIERHTRGTETEKDNNPELEDTFVKIEKGTSFDGQEEDRSKRRSSGLYYDKSVQIQESRRNEDQRDKDGKKDRSTSIATNDAEEIRRRQSTRRGTLDCNGSYYVPDIRRGTVIKLEKGASFDKQEDCYPGRRSSVMHHNKSIQVQGSKTSKDQCYNDVKREICTSTVATETEKIGREQWTQCASLDCNGSNGVTDELRDTIIKLDKGTSFDEQKNHSSKRRSSGSHCDKSVQMQENRKSKDQRYNDVKRELCTSTVATETEKIGREQWTQCASVERNGLKDVTDKLRDTIIKLEKGTSFHEQKDHSSKRRYSGLHCDKSVQMQENRKSKDQCDKNLKTKRDRSTVAAETEAIGPEQSTQRDTFDCERPDDVADGNRRSTVRSTYSTVKDYVSDPPKSDEVNRSESTTDSEDDDYDDDEREEYFYSYEEPTDAREYSSVFKKSVGINKVEDFNPSKSDERHSVSRNGDSFHANDEASSETDEKFDKSERKRSEVVNARNSNGGRKGSEKSGRESDLKPACFEPNYYLSGGSSREIRRLLTRYPTCFDKNFNEYDNFPSVDDGISLAVKKKVKEVKNGRGQSCNTAGRCKIRPEDDEAPHITSTKSTVVAQTQITDPKGITVVVTKSPIRILLDRDEQEERPTGTYGRKSTNVDGKVENVDPDKYVTKKNISKVKNGCRCYEGKPKVTERTVEKDEAVWEKTLTEVKRRPKNQKVKPVVTRRNEITEVSPNNSIVFEKTATEVKRNSRYAEGKVKGDDDLTNPTDFKENASNNTKMNFSKSDVTKRNEITEVSPNNSIVFEKTATEVKRNSRYAEGKVKGDDDLTNPRDFKENASNNTKMNFSKSDVGRSLEVKKISVGCGTSETDITAKSGMENSETEIRKNEKQKNVRFGSGEEKRVLDSRDLKAIDEGTLTSTRQRENASNNTKMNFSKSDVGRSLEVKKISVGCGTSETDITAKRGIENSETEIRKNEKQKNVRFGSVEEKRVLDSRDLKATDEGTLTSTRQRENASNNTKMNFSKSDGRSLKVKKISVGCGTSETDITVKWGIENSEAVIRKNEKKKNVRFGSGEEKCVLDSRDLKAIDEGTLTSPRQRITPRKELDVAIVGRTWDTDTGEKMPINESESSLRFHVRAKDGSIVGVRELDLQQTRSCSGYSEDEVGFIVENERLTVTTGLGDHSRQKSTYEVFRADRGDASPRRTVSTTFRSQTKVVQNRCKSPPKRRGREEARVLWAVARINEFGEGERTLEIISTDDKKPPALKNSGHKEGKYENEVYVILPPNKSPANKRKASPEK